jgi:hypothetical protein
MLSIPVFIVWCQDCKVGGMRPIINVHWLDRTAADLAEQTGATWAACREALISWGLTTAADVRRTAPRFIHLREELAAAVALDRTQQPLPGDVGAVRQTATPAARFELPPADPADFTLTAESGAAAQRSLWED